MKPVGESELHSKPVLERKAFFSYPHHPPSDYTANHPRLCLFDLSEHLSYGGLVIPQVNETNGNALDLIGETSNSTNGIATSLTPTTTAVVTSQEEEALGAPFDGMVRGGQ